MPQHGIVRWHIFALQNLLRLINEIDDVNYLSSVKNISVKSVAKTKNGITQIRFCFV